MRRLLTSNRQARDQRPPDFPWELNWDCASAQGLLGFWPLGYESYSERNAAQLQQAELTPTNGPTLVTSGGDIKFGRLFSSASSQYLEASMLLVSAEPITMACWANLTAIGATAQVMVAISKVADAGSSSRWNLRSAATTGVVQALSQDTPGTTSASAASAGAMVAGEWTHMTAVFAGAADRRAYRNGAEKGTNTTSVTVGPNSATTIGASRINAAAQYANATIAHACIWERALDDAGVARLYDPETRWELYYPIGRKTWSFAPAAAGTTRGMPFGTRSTAFNGGRCLKGPIA